MILGFSDIGLLLEYTFFSYISTNFIIYHLMSFWTVSQVKQDVFSPVVDSSPLLDYQEKLDSCFLVFLWFWICLNFTHWEGHQIIHRLMINSNRSLKKKIQVCSL